MSSLEEYRNKMRREAEKQEKELTRSLDTAQGEELRTIQLLAAEVAALRVELRARVDEVEKLNATVRGLQHDIRVKDDRIRQLELTVESMRSSVYRGMRQSSATLDSTVVWDGDIGHQ